MRTLKTTALFIAAVLVLCIVASSPALAAQPEFLSSDVGYTLLMESGTTTIRLNGTPLLTCSKDRALGKIANKTTIDEGNWTIERCTSPRSCPRSITFELTGELGEVAKAEATSEVGLMFRLGGEIKCGTEEIRITGNVAGEVTQIGALTLDDELKFELAASKQKVKSITIGGHAIRPELLASVNGGTPLPLTMESTELNEFEHEIEITP
jgi:hypothetical protein